MQAARPLVLPLHRRAAFAIGLLLLALLAVLARSGPASATVGGPANDDFANARTLSGSSGSLLNDMDGATRQAGEPASTGANSIWFKWKATFSGAASIDNEFSSCQGPGFTSPEPASTMPHVYTGTALSNLQKVGTAGSFTAVAGTTYYVDIDAHCSLNFSTGTLRVNWNPPANGTSAHAVTLNGNTGSLTGNSNRGADASYEAAVDETSNSLVWFKWTPSITGQANFAVRNAGFPAVVGALLPCNDYGCYADYSQVDSQTGHEWVWPSNDDMTEFHATAGTQYWIGVASAPGTQYPPAIVPQGTFDLQWSMNPPANDDVEKAQVITPWATTVTGTTVNSTGQPGEPSIAGQQPKNSVWYEWTPAASGAASVQTKGSSFDTVLGVYSGDDSTFFYNAPTAVGANDDIAPGVHASRVSFNATKGTHYWFDVAGYNGASGYVELSVNPPANDDFASAQVLNSASGIVTGTTAGSTGETSEPQHAGHLPLRTLWYTATAPASGPATISMAGSSIDTAVEVYTGSSLATLQSKGFNDNFNGSLQSKFNFAAVAGQKYYFAVSGVPAAEGSVQLQWAFARPTNDDVASPQVLSGATGEVTGTNQNATGEPNEPTHLSSVSDSVWYSYTPDSSGPITITTRGSSFDTTLGVFTGIPATSMKTVVQNDDHLFARQSQLTFPGVAGTNYLIAVNGYGGASGAIDLQWSSNPPANDNIAAAQELPGSAGSVSGTVTGATGEPGDPADLALCANRTVWYSITAASDGPASIDTYGSSVDTSLGVYTGVPGSLHEVALNDDANGPQSQLNFAATAGTNYYIAVGGNYSQQGPITLHYHVGNPAISAGDTAVAEGSGANTTVMVPVTLSHPGITPVTVNYTTANGSATAPADYTATTGTLTFPVGVVTQQVPVTIAADALNEDNETFTVQLSSPTNSVLAHAAATVTINDDDPKPVTSISNAGITEGAAGTTAQMTFNVSLSAPSGRKVTVNWATAAGGTATAATDYQSASGVVTFAPGETLKQVPVTVLGDNLNELNETVVVALTNPVSTTIGTANGTGVITDDDPKPAASISDATIFEGNSGQSNLTFTVNLSAASGRDVTLAWTTKDGTATVANSDYVAGSGTLSFAAGETSKTITVLVNGDHNVEADETFTVLLSSPVNVTLADASGLGTILNDD